MSRADLVVGLEASAPREVVSDHDDLACGDQVVYYRELIDAANELELRQRTSRPAQAVQHEAGSESVTVRSSAHRSTMGPRPGSDKPGRLGDPAPAAGPSLVGHQAPETGA